MSSYKDEKHGHFNDELRLFPRGFAWLNRLGEKLLDDSGFEAILLSHNCAECHRTVYQIIRDHMNGHGKGLDMLTDEDIKEIEQES